jgi:hypothetical protein
MVSSHTSGAFPAIPTLERVPIIGFTEDLLAEWLLGADVAFEGRRLGGATRLIALFRQSLVQSLSLARKAFLATPRAGMDRLPPQLLGFLSRYATVHRPFSMYRAWYSCTSLYNLLSSRAMIILSMPLGCAVSTAQRPCMPIPHKRKPGATQLLTWHHAADRLINSHYSAVPPGR